MAIMLPFIQKDVFGGPAGSTRNAMQTIVEGILQGAAKRKQTQQNQVLSSLFADQSGQYGPPRSSEMFIESLLSDPALTQQSKNMGLVQMSAVSDIGLNQAKAKAALVPEREKTKDLKIYSSSGEFIKTVLVPESQYNAAVDQVTASGYKTEEPKVSSFGQMIAEYEALPEGSPLKEIYKNKLTESNNATVNVGVNMPAQEEKFREKLGEFYAEEFSGMQKESREAQVNMNRLERADGLVKQLNTGKLKPTTSAIKAVVKDLGMDVEKYGLSDDVGLAQALNAVSIDLTMDTVARTKGAVSDKEMALFAQVAPQLSNTVEGNILIIEMAKKLNENKVKVANLARRYLTKNKRFDEGFYDELEKFHAENPLFTNEVFSEINKLTGATKEAQSRGITNPAQPAFQEMSDEELKKQLGITK